MKYFLDETTGEKQVDIYCELGSDKTISILAEHCSKLADLVYERRRALTGIPQTIEDMIDIATVETAGKVLLLLDMFSRMGYLDLGAAKKSALKELDCWHRRVFGEKESAGVAQIKHGEWLSPNADSLKCNCSVCGGNAWHNTHNLTIRKSQFCPNCGAIMDGGDHDA